MRCVRRSARRRNRRSADRPRASTATGSCGRAGSAPIAATSRSTARRSARAPSAGSQSRWCMSKCAQRRARSFGRISSKYAVPGSGVRIVKPAWNSRWRSTNAHSRSKSPSRHAGSITKLPGDAVAEPPRHLDALRGLIDGRVLHQSASAPRWSPPRGRRRCRSRARSAATPRAAPDGARPDRRGSARASTASGCRGAELARQREAARRMVPEQIVGDEDVIADRREVAADRVDRSLAHRAGVQLPDRAERAAERTALARSRSATPADAPDRRTGGATAPRDAAPAAARRRARASRSRRRCGCLRPRRRAARGRARASAAARARAPRTGAASRARRRRAPRQRHRATGTDPDRPPRCARRRRSGTSGESARTRAASASTSSVSSACMAAMPTSPGRAATHLVLERCD